MCSSNSQKYTEYINNRSILVCINNSVVSCNFDGDNEITVLENKDSNGKYYFPLEEFAYWYEKEKLWVPKFYYYRYILIKNYDDNKEIKLNYFFALKLHVKLNSATTSPMALVPTDLQITVFPSPVAIVS